MLISKPLIHGRTGLQKLGKVAISLIMLHGIVTNTVLILDKGFEPIWAVSIYVNIGIILVVGELIPSYWLRHFNNYPKTLSVGGVGIRYVRDSIIWPLTLWNYHKWLTQQRTRLHDNTLLKVERRELMAVERHEPPYISHIIRSMPDTVYFELPKGREVMIGFRRSAMFIISPESEQALRLYQFGCTMEIEYQRKRRYRSAKARVTFRASETTQPNPEHPQLIAEYGITLTRNQARELDYVYNRMFKPEVTTRDLVEQDM